MMSDLTIHDAPDLSSVLNDRDDAWSRERRAFAQMLPSLLKTHRDQYVAVHGGKVVAVGMNLVDTALEAYRLVGYVPVYVNLVTDRPRLPIRIPSPRLPENMRAAIDIELVEDNPTNPEGEGGETLARRSAIATTSKSTHPPLSCY